MNSSHQTAAKRNDAAVSFWDDKARSYFSLEHHSLAKSLYPAVQNLLTPKLSKECRLLDFGCGDGRLASLFIEKASVYIYDKSPLSRELANLRLKGNLSGTFSSVREIPDGTFDIVICSMILVCLPTLSEFSTVIRQVRNVTAPGGCALFAVTHPAFRDRAYSDFTTQYSSSGVRFNYFAEAVPFRVTMFNPDGSATAEIEDYHWKISTTLNELIQNGFNVERVDEPRDVSSKSGGNLDVPPFLVILCSVPSNKPVNAKP